jgi:hypothetical protein
MNKHNIDYEGLSNKFNTPKLYKLADVQDRIEHIGCGVVRFTDEANKVGLWQIQQGSNGEEYIAAMYDDVDSDVVKHSWSIKVDRMRKSATIFYKNTPIKNVIFASLGIQDNDINNFVRFLPNKLANDKVIVAKMLNEVDENYKQKLINNFPELSK